MTTPQTNGHSRELEKLEATIVKGLLAYARRNEIISELVKDGHKQADITRRINAVRTKLGAPTITPDAVAATIKRKV
jgi:hypothetical protein